MGIKKPPGLPLGIETHPCAWSYEIGYYGGEFLPKTLDKIKILRELRSELDIEVDGGIRLDTIGKANEAGANMFVSGSYLVNSKNIRESMNVLKNKINKKYSYG